MQTRMDLFSDTDLDTQFMAFNDLKDKILTIRTKYLTYIPSRKKNIIRIENLDLFEIAISDLREQMNQIKEELYGSFFEKILSAKEHLQEELFQYLEDNPSQDMLRLKTSETRSKLANRKAEKIVNHIKFPEPDSIIGKIDIRYHKYEFPFQDLTDNTLVKEFESAHVMGEGELSAILTLQKVFSIKPLED